MRDMENPIAGLFLDYSYHKLEAMTDHLQFCLGKLTDAQIWERHGAHENSVGNLMLHLCGNMRQWVISGVGGALDVRKRDEEFCAAGGMDGEELMGRFSVTVAEALKVIGGLPAERLTERITPQNHEVSVLEAIYQVVGHLQQHTGQIILLTKQMTGTDLDLTMPRKR
jgi:Protein of unknown function (DUF1572)